MFKITKFKRAIFFLIFDAILLSFSFYFSYSLRFDFSIDPNFKKQLFYWLPIIVFFKIILLSYYNLYSISWRYVSITEFFSIIKAFTIILIAEIIFDHFALYYSRKIFIPRTVPFIDYFISIFLISFLRISKRAFIELVIPIFKKGKRTLIIGAGNNGERLVRSLKYENSKDYYPVGFLDDDENKLNTYIHGIKVYGGLKQLKKIIDELKIEAVIIAIPNLPYYILREIIDTSKEKGIDDIKIVPEILTEREFKSSELKDLNIQALLKREVVEIEEEKIEDFFKGKNILVTGAGGSIGSEICRKLLKFNPAKILGYEIDETDIFNLNLELSNKKFIPVVGDINNSEKFFEVLKEHKIDIVFHSAAYKHVPLMEFFPEEAVKTNIIGTYNIAKLCCKNNVEEFINISTDKAVNPKNIMGMTKRIAEIICSSFNELKKTKFISVRFGNVLGSRGSVIPIFLEQIKKGGPVTVTHPEMERYFMTIPEAVLLVFQASIIGRGGEVFILDMGKPVKILDLAKNLIRLQGFTPDVDIKIEFTGIRPGEKIKEELFNNYESQIHTSHKKIFKANIVERVSIDDIEKFIENLKKNINKRDVLKTLLQNFLENVKKKSS